MWQDVEKGSSGIYGRFLPPNVLANPGPGVPVCFLAGEGVGVNITPTTFPISPKPV